MERMVGFLASGTFGSTVLVPVFGTVHFLSFFRLPCCSICMLPLIAIALRSTPWSRHPGATRISARRGIRPRSCFPGANGTHHRPAIKSAVESPSGGHFSQLAGIIPLAQVILVRQLKLRHHTIRGACKAMDVKPHDRSMQLFSLFRIP
jgi:hypothetical protein